MRGEKAEKIILQKIVSYCNDISVIMDKNQLTREAFESDREVQLACGMCIIQIGELVSRLEDGFITAHPDVSWRQIKGMRNIYAHDYDAVDNDIVWETLTKEIPELRESIRKIQESDQLEH